MTQPSNQRLLTEAMAQSMISTAVTTPTASTTVAGKIMIAGSADITAGTDTSKAVTPAQLATKQAAGSYAAASHQHSATDINAGTLPVNRGGTGAASLTGLLKGTGTTAITAATAGTDYSAPGHTHVASDIKGGTATYVLTSDGTQGSWQPAPTGGGGTGGTISTTTTTDWNAATTTGFYRSDPAATNAPDSTNTYHGFTTVGTAYITQTAYAAAADLQYRRYYTVSSSTWSSWLRTPTNAMYNDLAPLGRLGSPTQNIDTLDLNNFTTTGFYRGSTMTNAPSDGWFWVIVQLHDANWCSQIAHGYTGPTAGQVWKRFKNSGTWTAWTRLIETVVPVADGGTGATTLTGILKGNGTSAVTAVSAPGGTIVGTNDTQTLTNKTIDTAGGNTIKINGNTLSATAGTASVSVPNSAGTLALSGLASGTQSGQTPFNQGFTLANYPTTQTGGTAQYVRLFTITGSSNGDANVQFMLSGLGDYGNTNRGNALVSFAIRNADSPQVRAWGFGWLGASGAPTLYTRMPNGAGTYVSELWLRIANFQHPVAVHILSSFSATYNWDSISTTAPTGLTAVTFTADMEDVYSKSQTFTQTEVNSAISTATASRPPAASGNIAITPATAQSNTYSVTGGNVTGAAVATINYFSGTATVTFPAGRFSSTPAVTCSPNSAAATQFPNQAMPSSLSATGFTVTFIRTNSTNTGIQWTAIQTG